MDKNQSLSQFVCYRLTRNKVHELNILNFCLKNAQKLLQNFPTCKFHTSSF